MLLPVLLCPSHPCPQPSTLIPVAPFPGLSEVHWGLGSPGSLFSASSSLGVYGEQPGLTPQPEASGSSRAKGHIPGPSQMQPSQPKPAAPHKGAAEKSQVGKVSDLRLSGNEKHWLRPLAKPGAGPGGYTRVRTRSGLWGIGWLVGKQAPENFFLGSWSLPSVSAAAASIILLLSSALLTQTSWPKGPSNL